MADCVVSDQPELRIFFASSSTPLKLKSCDVFHYRFSTKVGEDVERGIGQYVVKSIMQFTKVSSAR